MQSWKDTTITPTGRCSVLVEGKHKCTRIVSWCASLAVFARFSDFWNRRTALCCFGLWMTQPVHSCLPEDILSSACVTLPLALAVLCMDHLHRVEGVVLAHELSCTFSFRKVGNSCKIEITWSTALKIQPSVKLTALHPVRKAWLIQVKHTTIGRCLCWNSVYTDACIEMLWEKNTVDLLKSTARVVQQNRGITVLRIVFHASNISVR
jgi:hypothetical protein